VRVLLSDTEGKIYRRKRGRVLYRVGEIKVDPSYRPYYGFDVVTVKLVRLDGKGNKWVVDGDFRYNFIEMP